MGAASAQASDVMRKHGSRRPSKLSALKIARIEEYVRRIVETPTKQELADELECPFSTVDYWIRELRKYVVSRETE